ncbi:hypothetical protein HIM_08865 [Hirsutella minnesotensis 3608]|uniref:Uncharacterized protein n=1 Tax=Hirsutella minnesotensis 3608 TaxID=1043627 RepID=A0A0F7ZSP5_9HYPO|nr:hypothetical protein HIM_08865 [Hirsutella minnesotensis 3608]
MTRLENGCYSTSIPAAITTAKPLMNEQCCEALKGSSSVHGIRERQKRGLRSPCQHLAPTTTDPFYAFYSSWQPASLRATTRESRVSPPDQPIGRGPRTGERGGVNRVLMRKGADYPGNWNLDFRLLQLRMGFRPNCLASRTG